MRGSIKKRYKNSWSVILDLGLAPDPKTGRLKRKQKWITVRGTRRDAEKKLADSISAFNKSEFVEPSKVTLGAWLLQWVQRTKAKVRAGTYTRYKGIIDQYLVPSSLGGLPIQSVTASIIEDYYAAHSALAPATLGLHHTILQRAFRTAVRDKLVTRNVAAEVEGKPRARRDAGQDARIHCWTAEEARTFLQVARAAGAQPAAFYTLALVLGARKGELCGLRWCDIDLEAGKVTIVRQLLHPGKQGQQDPVFGPTKTGRPRTIDVDAGTVALLVEHKRQQAELKMKHRTTYRDLGLVFCRDAREHPTSMGLPLHINNLGQREYARLIKAAKVRPIKFHGLRHTCATLLLAAGEPVHVVSERLGHASPTMTLTVYSHVVGNMQQRAAATVGGLLHGS